MMKTHQIHGVISLSLVLMAIGLAAAALFMSSAGLAVAYLAGCAVGAFAMLYGYCAKCPNKHTCGHVFPGMLAQLFDRVPAPYTPLEYGILGIAFLMFFGFPQFWLWQFPRLFLAFWGLVIIGGAQILSVMCRSCGNTHCPLNRSTQRP